MSITIDGTGTISGLTATCISAAQTVTRSALPAGSVLQVISTTKLDAFQSTSGTMVDITGLSVNITPTSASNKILIIVSMIVSADSWDTGGMAVNLVRNSTNLAVGTSGSSLNATSGYNAWSNGAGNTGGNFSPMIISFVDSPSTTSSTTYKLQGRNNTGGYSFTVGRRMNDTAYGFSSTITVMEIAA
jgi:hypothetical protein